MQFGRTIAVVTAAVLLATAAQGDDWPQWRGKNRDGVWRESGIVEKLPEGQIPIKWRAEIGSGYSGPTVAGGRVYLMDRVTEPSQQERVLCFDAKNGKPVWSYAYDAIYRIQYTAGPRASVTIDEGRAVALGAMGHLHCFDAASGSILWKKDLDEDYQIRMPIWGIACSPLVEKDLVIVVAGGENACLVAFDKTTGRERWKSLDDRAQYSSPIVVDQAGKRVLVYWSGDNVVGVNPQTGEEYWKQPMKPVQMPIGAATPVSDGSRVYVSSFYDGSLMLGLREDKPSAEEIWRKRGRDEQHTDALHCMISTPVLDGDYIYGVDSYGELRCLNAKTGERIWESLEATPKARWSNIHIVRHEPAGASLGETRLRGGRSDRYAMFNERGDLIFARLSPRGYEELSRAKLIEPTTVQLGQRGGVCWSHPAYADKHVFARNDKELVCASLAEE
jgi:outer membrane protein assembly factor BamB